MVVDDGSIIYISKEYIWVARYDSRYKVEVQREDYTFVTIMPQPTFDCFDSEIKTHRRLVTEQSADKDIRLRMTIIGFHHACDWATGCMESCVLTCRFMLPKISIMIVEQEGLSFSISLLGIHTPILGHHIFLPP